MPVDNDWYSGMKHRHRLFADEADRLGDATSYVTADIGTYAIQLDDGTAYVLQSLGPIAWVPVGAPALSEIPFSISWSGGVGDFKLTDAGPGSSQTFDLAALLAGITGALQFITMDVTEAFAGPDTNYGFQLNASGMTPVGAWLYYVSAPGVPEMPNLKGSGTFKRVFSAGDRADGGARTGRSWIGPDAGMEYDPHAQFLTDGGAGSPLSNTSAGHVDIILHYFPTP